MKELCLVLNHLAMMATIIFMLKRPRVAKVPGSGSWTYLGKIESESTSVQTQENRRTYG